MEIRALGIRKYSIHPKSKFGKSATRKSKVGIRTLVIRSPEIENSGFGKQTGTRMFKNWNLDIGSSEIRMSKIQVSTNCKSGHLYPGKDTLENRKGISGNRIFAEKTELESWNSEIVISGIRYSKKQNSGNTKNKKTRTWGSMNNFGIWENQRACVGEPFEAANRAPPVGS